MEVKSLAANSAAVVFAVLFGSAPEASGGLAMESDTSPVPLSEEGWCAGTLHLIVRAGRNVRVSICTIFSNPRSCRPVATGRKCQGDKGVAAHARELRNRPRASRPGCFHRCLAVPALASESLHVCTYTRARCGQMHFIQDLRVGAA